MNLVLCVISLALWATSEADFWASRAGRVVNCAVSPWSDWSTPGPDGRRTRTRSVDRPASNGGSDCPALTEIQGGVQGDPWSRNQTERKFHNKFMTGHTHYYNFVNGGGVEISGASSGDGGLTLLPRDLLFIIDMSGSISRSDWHTTKVKLAQLIGKLCGTIGRGRQNNRIAIVTYSRRVVLNFNFRTHWSLNSVRRAILGMRQDRQVTCTGDALNYAHQYMFEPDTGIRSATESVKEVLVLTDGHSNCGAQLSLAVRRLQVKAFVFALAIGDFGSRGRAEIESMVSRPLIDHIFSLANFFKFREMVDIILRYPHKCAPFELS